MWVIAVVARQSCLLAGEELWRRLVYDLLLLLLLLLVVVLDAGVNLVQLHRLALWMLVLHAPLVKHLTIHGRQAISNVMIVDLEH